MRIGRRPDRRGHLDHHQPIVAAILQKAQGVAGIVNLAVDIAYFAYF